MNRQLFLYIFAFCVICIFIPTTPCTSFLLKTLNNYFVYGRTCEWGLFDAQADLVLTPRNYTTTSDLGYGVKGMTWKAKYGYVAINGLGLPYYLDGMNETGLTVGGLYLPWFSQYQPLTKKHSKKSIHNFEMVGYLLGTFQSVAEIKRELPKIYVVTNQELSDKIHAPMPLHYVVTDKTGASIVIEYTGSQLHIYDNTTGIMTNSPDYNWHLTNLRNYTQLNPYAAGPSDRMLSGINFSPLSSGYGMAGLPGDYSSPSRFVRAFFYTHTSLPLKNVDDAINQASRILNNFDYPKGIVRSGESEKNFNLSYTQWSVIGDIKNKTYYWWTEWNRQMRKVDLKKINFTGTVRIKKPLDKKRAQAVEDRAGDFAAK